MIDIDDVWSPMNSEQINVNINGDGTYEDLMLIDEEFDEPNVYFDDEIHGDYYSNTIYAEAGDDTILGSGGNDTLFGGSGNDLLKGDAGRDTIQGDSGKDTMFGGSSADTFIFTKTSDSSANASRADVIRDFTDGVDKINLRAIDASTDLSGNNKFTFDGTTSFGTSKQGDVYYKKFNKAGTANDYTMVYIDTDDDRATEMSIRLTGLFDLGADDFIL